MKKLLFFSRKIGFIRDAMLKIALLSHWGIHLICCMSNCIRSDKKKLHFFNSSVKFRTIIMSSHGPKRYGQTDQQKYK